MAKKTMKLKYKPAKRERNKNIIENTDPEIKTFILNLVGVLAFIGLVYLGIMGLNRLGLFEAGYTAPTKDETTIDYENISIGTVFNRSEKSYYVIFDNYSSNYSSDPYVNALLNNQKEFKVYKVDMSKNENANYSSEESNSKAKNPSELKVNGLTLIKISNGKISKYITGSEKIEEYLK